jgi:cysteine desulfurase/selenocysteine lyase
MIPVGAPSATARTVRLETPGLDVARIREDFPALRQTVNGKPLIYLDNAATAQKP